MKALVHLVAGLLFAILASAASAHPNHGDGPPVAKEELPALGERVVLALVQGKQLAPSWQGKPPKEISSRETPLGMIWVMSYENSAEADRSKRTMYLFFDEGGNFIGGNHSGKLQ